MLPICPEQIRLLHDNYKPRWGPGSLLMYAIPGKVGKTTSAQIDKIICPTKTVIVSEGRDIRFAKVGASSNVSPTLDLRDQGRHQLLLMIALQLTRESLHLQRANTKIAIASGVPMARTAQTPFANFAAAIDPASAYERAVMAAGLYSLR